jgi:hypothetical protein
MGGVLKGIVYAITLAVLVMLAGAVMAIAATFYAIVRLGPVA